MSGLSNYFVSTADQPRVRRASDAVTLIVGFVILLWAALTFDTLTPFERAVVGVFDVLPEWTDAILSLAYSFGLLYALFLVIASAFQGKAGLSTLRDIVLAGVGAAFLTLLLVRWSGGSWPYILPEIGLEDPDPQFPVFRIAIVTAILIAAGPHIARPLRRLGWFIVIVMALAALGLGFGFPSDALGGVAVGMVAAGTVLLGFGSPEGYPDAQTVKTGLAMAGLAVGDVRLARDQSWGVRRLVASAEDGEEYDVKAYGRDATDSQVMAKAWRSVWYRETGPSLTYSRLQGVEHEALVTMIAGRTGAAVPEVVTAAQPDDEVALLVLTRVGQALSHRDGDDIPDEMLRALWADVARIHATSISHGSLTMQAIRFNGDRFAISDFTFGDVTATDTRLALDVVELLFSMSMQVGAQRAVAGAVHGLGPDQLARALPYLQLPAVSAATRRQAKKPKITMKEIREQVATVTGEELPPPAKVRRVSGRSLLMAGLLFVAAYAFIPMIVGIDFAAVWDVLEDATWIVVLLALGVGHLVFIPEATGMMFAAGQSLPLWPLTSLQVSVKFIGLAVPSVAGRVAMNAAFLHKYGISATESVTQGAIDGLSGFLVEAMILLVAFIASDVSLDLDVNTGDVNWGLVLLIVVLVVAGLVVSVLRIARLRAVVVPVLRSAWGALANVLKQPRMALGLLGSNLAARLILAFTLWLVLQAIDQPISFSWALVAVVATNLLAGLVPIPGGIGVAETFMTGILVVLGIPEAAAFAATITYRMITFYLPAVEGYFAMRWLEAKGFL